jgi:hypothetical protein
MQAWLEIVAVTALVAAGWVLGNRLSATARRWWPVALGAPFAVVLAIVLARRSMTLAFTPPFRWIVSGRLEYVILGPSIMIILAMLIPHLKSKMQRALVAAFACLAAGNLTILPFALPALNAGYLRGLDTQVNADGVCLQNTAYTCGPAAAVTALRTMGVYGSEGEIAVLSRSNPVSGTEPDLLCDALDRRYGERGIACEYRAFSSIGELKGDAVMIALVKYSLFVDHYVAVLDVSDGKVTVGDPLKGQCVVPVGEFEKEWRFAGIVMKRR